MVYVGWYAVRPVAEVKPREVHGFAFAGSDWVVYRTEAGEARVAENRCSHLGGRLDRTGQVVGDRLACSLHGYRFDGEGRGAREGRCALRQPLNTLPVVEHAGMVFAWYDPAGGAPRFDLPEIDEDGWSPWSFRAIELPTRPELIMQDLVDADHYETIHDYRNISYLKPPTYEPHRLSVEVAFDWDTSLPGPARNHPASFKSEARGVGYQFTQVCSAWGRYHTRHLVLPVPVDDETSRVYLGVSSRITGRLGRGLPGRVAQPLGNAFIRAMFRRDIARDARLWVDTYPMDDAPPPDEAIAAYRHWLTGLRSTSALQEFA